MWRGVRGEVDMSNLLAGKTAIITGGGRLACRSIENFSREYKKL